MKQRTVLHVDLNSFYASVACLYQPALRKVPMAVGGDESRRLGVVLAKNDLAKKCGVKTGEPLSHARQKCPELVVTAPEHQKYLAFSKMARNVYERYTSQIESFGLDEVWMDVTNSAIRGNGESIAREIRATLLRELGLTASVGNSYNKIFAKLGSDMKKPDATTTISEGNYRQKVWPLPASDLLFIGASTYQKLTRCGLHSIGDIAQCDADVLQMILGKMGKTLWVFANGQDDSPVLQSDAETAVKSVGNSTTTFRDLTCLEDVKLIFYMLAESVATRLRNQGLRAKTLQISIRDKDLRHSSRQCKLPFATDLADVLAKESVKLFAPWYSWSKPIRSVGLCASELLCGENARQLSLLADQQALAQREELERSIDALRERFGPYAIQRGVMLKDVPLTRHSPKDEHVEPGVSFYH